MNESIKNSLIHLFAIITYVDIEDFSSNSRDIVKSYLNKHLSKTLADEYIVLFDNYFDFHHKDIFISKNELQQDKYLYLENVCKQINMELNRKERMYVFLQLCEFVNEDFVSSEKDTKILITVAKNFNLTDEEYNDITNFIFDKEAKSLNPEKTLIIENRKSSEDSEGAWFGWNKPNETVKSKNIFNKNIKGKIVVLHINSINMYIFRYFGNESLNIDGIAIIENVFFVLNPNSAISGKLLEPIYYSEINSNFSRFDEKHKVVFHAKKIKYRSLQSANDVAANNICGQSGHFVGIFSTDDSSNGKLLDIISGQVKADSSDILINNIDFLKNRQKFDGIVGYIQKDSILINNLSVYQNLHYNAKLYFNDYSDSQIKELVEKIIAKNNLQDVRNTIIQSQDSEQISKIQIKKINIAIELLRKATILFFENPTCGLSSADSDQIMHSLKEQANKNTLIFASVERCSSDVFKLFDKICILDQGYQIFYGTPSEAIIYFKKAHTHLKITESICPFCGNINHNQILQIIEAKIVDEFGRYTNQRKITAKEWHQAYEEKTRETKSLNVTNGCNDKDLVFPIRFFNTVNSFKQFSIFLKSKLQVLFANKKYLFFTLLLSPLFTLFFAFLSKSYVGEKYILVDNASLPNYLLFSVFVALFLGFSISINEIVKDKYLLKHFDFINLNKFSYYNSKIFVLILISAIQILIYVLFGNFILGIEGMTLKYFIILFAISVFAVMLGLLFSQIFSSKSVLFVIIPVFLVFQYLFSGVPIKFDNFPKSLKHEEYVPLIADFSVARWGFEALAVEQFSWNNYEKHFFAVEKEIISANNKYKLLIPKLISLLEDCEKYFRPQYDVKKIENNLNILQNEIPLLWTDENRKPFEYINQLNLKDFSPEVSNSCNNYLEFLKWQNKSLKKAKTKEYNEISSSLINSIGMYEVNRLKSRNYNQELAKIVSNEEATVSMINSKNRLILKKDPIYFDARSKFGRTHFFSPNKKILENYYNTFLFNILIICLFSFLVYLILLSEIVPKTIERISRFYYLGRGLGLSNFS